MSGFAADDTAAIAKRLKELEEEKRGAIANLPGNLPCDVEPSGLRSVYVVPDEATTISLAEFWAMVRRSGFLGDA